LNIFPLFDVELARHIGVTGIGFATKYVGGGTAKGDNHATARTAQKGICR
jgi:hypothetical protein